MKVGNPQDAFTMSKLSSPAVPKELSALSRKESPEQIMAAAQSFEAIFVNQLLKSMRATLPEDGLMENSFAKGMFTEMLDKEYAQMSVKSRSFGLADMIARQFGINPDDLKSALPTTDGDSLNATPDLHHTSSYSISYQPKHAKADTEDEFDKGKQRLETDTSKSAKESRIDEYGEEFPAWAMEEIKDVPRENNLWEEDPMPQQTKAEDQSKKEDQPKTHSLLDFAAPHQSQVIPGLSPPKQSQVLKAYQELLNPERFQQK
jgi:Rod binding domain-containing protein